MTNCGPGKMQESTASSRTTDGDMLNRSAIPPQTPAMTRCFRERYIGYSLLVSIQSQESLATERDHGEHGKDFFRVLPWLLCFGWRLLPRQGFVAMAFWA